MSDRHFPWALDGPEIPRQIENEVRKLIVGQVESVLAHGRPEGARILMVTVQYPGLPDNGWGTFRVDLGDPGC